MIPVPKITKLDVAFPANVRRWLPPFETIPKEFHGDSQAKGARFFRALFYTKVRADRIGMLPKKGVDASQAWDALQMLLGTFSIKHEHKEAAFAYLCSEWFEDLRWETTDGKSVVTFEDKGFDALWLEQQTG